MRRRADADLDEKDAAEVGIEHEISRAAVNHSGLLAGLLCRPGNPYRAKTQVNISRKAVEIEYKAKYKSYFAFLAPMERPNHTPNQTSV
jgi:hypothetical protein